MVTLERRGAIRSTLPELRPEVRGKFLFVGDEKLYVRGVTYGTFRPDDHGDEFHDPDIVERDFALMAASGINAVRTYTPPPRWLLDSAGRHGLRVMVGLAWEQHIAFLDDRKRPADIESRVRAAVRESAGHPAVLCYVIGNETPSAIVRWHGARRVERFLKRLYLAVKHEDPDALVTYVNYPSTEYLDLPFVDFVSFNVYLESQDRLEAYLARLQNLAGERPLVMAEIGLDSRRNGEDTQARVLDWQIRTTFEGGCAGLFLFAWTDEWHRGGHDIDDWDFGLTRRNREPKPALAAVSDAFSAVPYPADLDWPRISVVVCTYNGSRTIRDTCDGLRGIRYPDFEVIIVDDGSTDKTGDIVAEYGFRLIRTEKSGLSAARNAGLAAATGEIVAYTDDDAHPDPEWLTYLAATFLKSNVVGVGGPNIAPRDEGSVAAAVVHAPGGPVHVLLTDTIAEHIPGCNMAFRRWALQSINGFDPRFHAAGDDVDVCWRLQDRGFQIGYNPAAMVWHYRRNSLRAYWKQQLGYGKAEALLEAKWPERYNAAGHVSWGGRLYGHGLTLPLPFSRGRIYHGTWGSAPFQSIYHPPPGTMWSLPLMPEWNLLILALAGLTALSAVWPVLLWTGILLALAIAAPIAQAVRSARSASAHDLSPDGRSPSKLLIAILHLIQPAARLRGRLRHGLTPWRSGSPHQPAIPICQSRQIWREDWLSPDHWLEQVEDRLLEHRNSVRRGSAFARWDLEVRGGIFGGARMRAAVEEHGAGRQLGRFRIWPNCSKIGAVALLLSLGHMIWIFLAGDVLASIVFAVIAAAFLIAILADAAVATGALLDGVEEGKQTGVSARFREERTSS